MIPTSKNIERVFLIKGDPNAGKTTTAAKLFKKLSDDRYAGTQIKLVEQSGNLLEVNSFTVKEAKQSDFCAIITVKGKTIACLSMGDKWGVVLDWLKKLFEKTGCKIDILIGCCRRKGSGTYNGYHREFDNSKIEIWSLKKRFDNEPAKSREARENAFADLMYKAIRDIL